VHGPLQVRSPLQVHARCCCTVIKPDIASDAPAKECFSLKKGRTQERFEKRKNGHFQPRSRGGHGDMKEIFNAQPHAKTQRREEDFNPKNLRVFASPA
jgi:hypothetical protein